MPGRTPYPHGYGGSQGGLATCPVLLSSLHILLSSAVIPALRRRILGKYGGVPAMGSGMVMPLPPKDMKLKATASPAAIEIQYSKVAIWPWTLSPHVWLAWTLLAVLLIA